MVLTLQKKVRKIITCSIVICNLEMQIYPTYDFNVFPHAVGVLFCGKGLIESVFYDFASCRKEQYSTLGNCKISFWLLPLKSF